MDDDAKWIQRVVILVKHEGRVIMARVSLQGRPGASSLSAVNDRIAWVTGDNGYRPASANTPTSTPWSKNP